MNAFQKKVTLRVFGIHAAIILMVLVVFPFLQSCFRPKPDDVFNVVMVNEVPGKVSVQEVSRMDDPAPPDQPSPPAEIPEEVTPPPPKVPVPTPKTPTPTPKKPEKPKWEPTKASDIDTTKSTRINSSPQAPSVPTPKIEGAFDDLKSSPQAGNPSQFNAYINSIGAYFRRYWTPPSSASSASGIAVVRVSMRKNGQVTKRVKIQSSGDSVFDTTVMNALNSVNTIPRPPANYPHGYVEIEFKIRN